MLTIFLILLHVIACVVLILVVLLQQGKGADWAGAFGGGGSQTVFGPRASGNIYSKLTSAAAVIFMLTSLALTITLSRPGGSSVIREDAGAPAPAPTTTSGAVGTTGTGAAPEQQTAPPAATEPEKKAEPEKK